MTGNPANNGGVRNAGFAPEVPRTRLSAPVDAAAVIRGGGCESAAIFVNKSLCWDAKIAGGMYAEIRGLFNKNGG
jgi:hypothetical protein